MSFRLNRQICTRCMRMGVVDTVEGEVTVDVNVVSVGVSAIRFVSS